MEEIHLWLLFVAVIAIAGITAYISYQGGNYASQAAQNSRALPSEITTLSAKINTTITNGVNAMNTSLASRTASLNKVATNITNTVSSLGTQVSSGTSSVNKNISVLTTDANRESSTLTTITTGVTTIENNQSQIITRLQDISTLLANGIKYQGSSNAMSIPVMIGNIVIGNNDYLYGTMLPGFDNHVEFNSTLPITVYVEQITKINATLAVSRTTTYSTSAHGSLAYNNQINFWYNQSTNCNQFIWVTTNSSGAYAGFPFNAIMNVTAVYKPSVPFNGLC